MNDPEAYGLYLQNGYSLIQNWAANTILQKATSKTDAQIATVVVPFKSPPTEVDFYPLVLFGVFPFFVQLMYIPFLYRTVNRVVGEKFTRAKESMRMMGMSDLAYWLSWWVYWTGINTAIATLCWAILIINVFQAKHGGIVWLFIWLFGQSLFGLLLIAQAIFSNPKQAASATSGIYFASSLIQTLFIKETTSWATKVAACWFLPTLTLSNGALPLANNFIVGGIASLDT